MNCIFKLKNILRFLVKDGYISVVKFYSILVFLRPFVGLSVCERDWVEVQKALNEKK